MNVGWYQMLGMYDDVPAFDSGAVIHTGWYQMLGTGFFDVFNDGPHETVILLSIISPTKQLNSLIEVQ